MNDVSLTLAGISKWIMASVFVLLLLLALGCSLDGGPDSVFSRDAYTDGEGLGCTGICHNGTIALDPVQTNGEGTSGKHVTHVETIATDCGQCHSGYKQQATHMDQTLQTENVVYFDSSNPAGHWTDDTGPQTGTCASLACHGTVSVEWYGASTAGPLDCTTCHSVQINTTRQVAGTGGDFGANPASVSWHVAGAGDPTRDQCLVCHDQSTHTQGTVRLRNADSGASLAYDPASPGTLETFCLSCHDADGALMEGSSAKAPFGDGKTLGVVPNVAGDKIASYWNNAYTNHKDQGLTCAGTGEPGTGCHGSSGAVNGHGSTANGILTRNLTLPIPANTPYRYEDYQLCFDCHDSSPSVSKEVVLGYKAGGNYDLLWWAPTPYYTSGIQSLFRDRYVSSPANYPAYWSGVSPAYNDSIWGDAYTPLHNYHLSPTDGWMQNVWSYRGTETGRASCTTCHNVHGTSGTVRSTYDEFGITAATGLGGDKYKELVPPTNYGDSVFKFYPINCAVSCHGIVGSTAYWHDPSDE